MNCCCLSGLKTLASISEQSYQLVLWCHKLVIEYCEEIRVTKTSVWFYVTINAMPFQQPALSLNPPVNQQSYTKMFYHVEIFSSAFLLWQHQVFLFF